MSSGIEDEDLGPTLLNDLEKMFSEKDTDRLFSEEIVEHLEEMEDRPWPEYKKGKPLSKRQLAILLKRYGAKPKFMSQDGKKGRGYLYSELEPLFIRYSDTPEVNSLKDKELAGTLRKREPLRYRIEVIPLIKVILEKNKIILY